MLQIYWWVVFVGIMLTYLIQGRQTGFYPVSLQHYAIFCPCIWHTEHTFTDYTRRLCTHRAQTPHPLTFGSTFNKKTRLLTVGSVHPILLSWKKWQTGHEQVYHVIGVELSYQSSFASCALAVTSTSVWLWQGYWQQTVIPLIQLLRLGLIYIHVHPL